MILPSLSSEGELIKRLIISKFGNIRETSDKTKTTIIVGNDEEVMSKYGSPYYYVTKKYLEGIDNMKSLINCKQCISSCLCNVAVKYTGFNKDSSMVIDRYTTLLGGAIASHINNKVSVLIAKSSLCQQVKEAQKLQIPVVCYDWIISCLESSSFHEYSDFSLLVFSGCVFTSSDLNSELSKQCKFMVSKNGGIWIDHLNDGVSFLVATSLNRTEKIRIALEFSIPIVTPDWLKMCISKNELIRTTNILNWWQVVSVRSPLFEGLRFFSESPYIKEAILAHSGSIVDSEKSADYVVSQPFNKNSESSECYITEKWIWSCIQMNAIIPIDSSPLFKPLSFLIPIQSLKGSVFSLIGLSIKLKDDISESIRLIGGIPIYKLHKTTQYVIVNDDYNENGDHQNILYIYPQFIYEILKTGNVPDPFLYSTKHRKQNNIVKLCNNLSTRKYMNSMEPTTQFSNIFDHSQNSNDEICIPYVIISKKKDKIKRIAGKDPIVGI